MAETLAQARDAAELIEVDYEPLPAVTNATEAMQDGAPQIWPDNPGNVCFESELGDKAATDVAFEKAKHIIKQRMVVNRSSANSMETRGTNADFDPVSGRCTVYVGVQGVFGMRNTLANAIFDDEIENFRVVTGHIGGSFGMKNFYAETIMTIWASRKLKRPVKWENDREKSLLSDYHGRDKVADLELALDADGIFLGIRANIIANMGAYLSPLFVAHTLLSNGGIIGVYKTPTAYQRSARYTQIQGLQIPTEVPIGLMWLIIWSASLTWQRRKLILTVWSSGAGTLSQMMPSLIRVLSASIMTAVTSPSTLKKRFA